MAWPSSTTCGFRARAAHGPVNIECRQFRCFSNFARTGGLLSYGPNLNDLYREAGAMAGKVLKGTNPAILPAERPTRFEMIVNLQTAKALNLTMPTSILLRADEVIE
jgi:putative ABC transport system substrate-binding protein